MKYDINVRWEAFGYSNEEVEADNDHKAREEAEQNADWDAVNWNEARRDATAVESIDDEAMK